MLDNIARFDIFKYLCHDIYELPKQYIYHIEVIALFSHTNNETLDISIWKVCHNNNFWYFNTAKVQIVVSLTCNSTQFWYKNYGSACYNKRGKCVFEHFCSQLSHKCKIPCIHKNSNIKVYPVLHNTISVHMSFYSFNLHEISNNINPHQLGLDI